MPKINVEHHKIKISGGENQGIPGKTQQLLWLNKKQYRVMISGGENHGKPKICQKSIENTIKLRFHTIDKSIRSRGHVRDILSMRKDAQNHLLNSVSFRTSSNF